MQLLQKNIPFMLSKESYLRSALSFRKLTFTLLLTIFLGCSKPPYQSYEYALQGLYSAKLSDNGEQVIVGSINHGASLWSFATDERKFNWNHKQNSYSQIIAAAFSPDNEYAITASPQTMVLWNTETGEGLSYWTAPSEILDIDLMPDGNFALLGLADHSAALFDVKRGGVQRVFYHDGRVNAVDAHAASNIILTGADDYSAKLWNIQTGKLLQKWNHDEEVQLVKISPDGSLAFTMAKYDKAAIWRVQDGSMLGQIPLGSSAIKRGLQFTAVAFSADSRFLLTGTSDRLIQLWDVSDLSEINRWKTARRDPLSPTSAAVLSLAFGLENNYYAITSDGFAHRLR